MSVRNFALPRNSAVPSWDVCVTEQVPRRAARRSRTTCASDSPPSLRRPQLGRRYDVRRDFDLDGNSFRRQSRRIA